MTSAPNIIEIDHLCTCFGRTVVHQDINLRVAQGEILSVVGGSGSGKTVLIRQMLGLERPYSGSVKVFGVDVHRSKRQALQDVRNNWGMLFQHGALYSALSVFENVARPLRELRTLPEDVITDIVLLKLHMVGLGPEHAKKMPANLSGGMIKRVALARAIALDPKLLFLDEPTAGLDPDRSESFVSLIKDLHANLNLTVVMVTHDLDTLFALSGRIAVLADKRVITTGSTREVVKFQHPFVEHFFLGGRGLRALDAMADQEKMRQ